MANETIMTNAEVLKSRRREKIGASIRYFILLIVGIIMIYPLVWLLGASAKDNTEIFTTMGFWPSHFNWELIKSNYIKGWTTATQYTFATYFVNSFQLIIPKVIATVFSAILVGYAFARFQFWGKKIFFTILVSSLMLPKVVLQIPTYVMFKEVGDFLNAAFGSSSYQLLDTYIPLWLPSAFGIDVFFTFMIVQFLRGIPQDMEEAAQIDGCNSAQVLWHIVMPLLKPAIASVVVFQFIWTMNDFMGPLIFIQSVEKYPVSLALRLGVSTGDMVEWGPIIAMSVVALLPTVLVFFSAQRYFVQGIASSGIKG